MFHPWLFTFYRGCRFKVQPHSSPGPSSAHRWQPSRTTSYVYIFRRTAEPPTPATVGTCPLRLYYSFLVASLNSIEYVGTRIRSRCFPMHREIYSQPPSGNTKAFAHLHRPLAFVVDAYMHVERFKQSPPWEIDGLTTYRPSGLLPR